MSKFRSRLASATLVWLGWMTSVGLGQVMSPPSSTSTAIMRSEEIAANSRAANAARTGIEGLGTTIGPRAIAKVDGIASPGLKLTLDGSSSSGGRVWYRWIQTQGPRVTIKASDQAEASLIVPNDATILGFVLVVGNSSGVDARSVIIEVEDPDRDSSEPSLQAVAGADQSASVGQRVILDGIKSEPKGRIRFRWVQSGGPKATITSTAGSTCSFVPEAAGTYQFALLVIGSTNIVSEASVVTVRVSLGTSRAEKVTPDRPSMAIDEMARVAIAKVPGGLKSAGELARVFDSVADRIDSFKNYNDATLDLTSRLDKVIPRDPSRRTDWLDQFYQPWTAKVAERMRAEGVDLSQPTVQAKPLSKAQRGRLADQFRLTAVGLRAGTSLR